MMVQTQFFARFKAECKKCEYHSTRCKFSGRLFSSVHFEIEQYFNLAFPQDANIPCPVFIDMKRTYDTTIQQAPVIDLLEKSKAGTNQDFFGED